MTTTAERLVVPVPGGELLVACWRGRPGAPTVVAAHGVTANHVSFEDLAGALGDDVTLVAPDLRGRGASNAISGPFGITAHADDLAQVLDHLDVSRAAIVGHSMGAWVATSTAVRHPDRVTALVLVDGGIPLPGVAGVPVDDVLDAVLGPSIARLSMTFPDAEAYREFWRQHPAVGGGYWSPLIERYVDYDLEGEPPRCRSRVSVEAVRGDAVEQLTVPEVSEALADVRCPVHLLFAPRGILDGDPLYSEEALAGLRTRWPAVVSEAVVPDVNHFTIVIGPGAPAVADVVRRASGG